MNFRNAFLKEVEDLQSDRKVKQLDFTGFFFPDIEMPEGFEFKKPLILSEASFTGKVRFSKVLFGEARFDKAVFQGKADFSSSTFGRITTFRYAVFEEVGIFEDVTFGPKLLIGKRRPIDFASAKFNEGARFHNAHFQQHSNFEFAYFAFGDFTEAIFERNAGFICAVFEHNTSFVQADFNQQGIFMSTEFENVDFRFILLNGLDFRFCKVKSRMTFSDFRMGSSEDDKLSAEFPRFDFRSVEIYPHAVVRFEGLNYDFDMSEVSLLHTDVRNVVFERVAWNTEEGFATGGLFRMIRKRPQRSIVYDEVHLVKGFSSEGGYHEARGPKHVAELYRRLRMNYEENLRFHEAGDFFVGEMEMERIARSPDRGIFSWIKRNFSFIALYKALSLYGQSYRRAGFWIIGSIIILALLRLLPGPTEWGFSVPSVWDAFSLSIQAFLQIDVVHVIDHIERLWAFFILAIFFLAVRKRFMRYSQLQG